jgi:hypothetical protein
MLSTQCYSKLAKPVFASLRMPGFSGKQFGVLGRRFNCRRLQVVKLCPADRKYRLQANTNTNTNTNKARLVSAVL